MKNVLILVVVAVVFISGWFFFSSQEPQVPNENQLDNQDEEIQEEIEITGTLEMQGYYINIPADYDCTGGFTDGYRFLDARCTPKSGEDYEIVVDFGLASTALGEDSFEVMYSFIRSHNTGAVCQPYAGDPEITLDAEHYVCSNVEDDKNVLTIGIGKSFDGFARHFSADLKRDDQIQEDDINKLVSFLNRAIDMDWDFFAGDR